MKRTEHVKTFADRVKQGSEHLSGSRNKHRVRSRTPNRKRISRPRRRMPLGLACLVFIVATCGLVVAVLSARAVIHGKDAASARDDLPVLKADKSVLGSDERTRQISARRFHVLRVIDGDTFVIRYDDELTRVRLARVDAPEIDTDKGKAAKKALVNLIDGKTVRIAFTDGGGDKRGPFGRLLCSVYAGPRDVEAILVKAGYAHYRHD